MHFDKPVVLFFTQINTKVYCELDKKQKHLKHQLLCCHISFESREDIWRQWVMVLAMYIKLHCNNDIDVSVPFKTFNKNIKY